VNAEGIILKVSKHTVKRKKLKPKVGDRVVCSVSLHDKNQKNQRPGRKRGDKGNKTRNRMA